MIIIQKRKYKKFKGRKVIGFSHPDRELTKIIPEGIIVGYGQNQLIVRCVNVVGWKLENMKEFHWIDNNESLDDVMGFWFIDKYELKEGLKEDVVRSM